MTKAKPSPNIRGACYTERRINLEDVHLGAAARGKDFNNEQIKNDENYHTN